MSQSSLMSGWYSRGEGQKAKVYECGEMSFVQGCGHSSRWLEVSGGVGQ